MIRNIRIDIAPSTAVSDIHSLEDVFARLGAVVELPSDYSSICIAYDEDALKTLLGRNAGRVRLNSEQLTWNQACILKESGYKNSEIAERAGVSLRTFYRRRKEYLEGRFDNNDFI